VRAAQPSLRHQAGQHGPDDALAREGEAAGGGTGGGVARPAVAGAVAEQHALRASQRVAVCVR
jgi:hypothetical protein